MEGNSFFSIGAHSEVHGHAKEPQRGMWIATLSDPDGNYFQLTTPWEGK